MQWFAERERSISCVGCQLCDLCECLQREIAAEDADAAVQGASMHRARVFLAKRSSAHRSRERPWTGPGSIGSRSIFVRGSRNRENLAWAAWAAHPNTGEAPSRAAARAHRSQRSRPMFDISCGDDGGPASCGIFGGSVGGGAAKQPQTLAGLLKKLDLSEYEPKFVAAGITDVLRPASRFRSVDTHTNARRSPPSPNCQKRSSTSSTCANSRNGSCGTTSRAPGCPTASRCGARRVSKKS